LKDGVAVYIFNINMLIR